jgi:hypothetical protein
MNTKITSFSSGIILIVMIFIIIISSIGAWFFRGGSGTEKEINEIMLSEGHGNLTIVYDNNPYNSSYLTAWGLDVL